MRRLIPLLLFLIQAKLAAAADGSASDAQLSDDLFADFQKKFRLSVRQSVADKNAVEKPATFHWVHSNDAGGSSSSSIDAGLTFRALDTTTLMVGPTAEYHRQTLTSKKQDNLQLGATAYYILGDQTEGLSSHHQLTVTYKDDRYTTGESVLAKITTSFLNPKLDLGFGTMVSIGSLRIVWQPAFGLQREEAENVRKTGLGGSTTRGYAHLDLALYPFGKQLRNRLEIASRQTLWRGFSRSAAFASLYDRDQSLFTVSATLFFDPARHFGLGIDYQNGENPEQGLQNQETTTLGLKVKF